ncbi:MAG: C2H2-type zinc finger protein, partial [Thermoprotei archaeon]
DQKPTRRYAEPKLFTCPHCGFVTPYEEEYWNHIKIHYIGF